jgi:hypothetical protein
MTAQTVTTVDHAIALVDKRMATKFRIHTEKLIPFTQTDVENLKMDAERQHKSILSEIKNRIAELEKRILRTEQYLDQTEPPKAMFNYLNKIKRG